MSYFYDRFGTMPQVEASAPGQVNLLGGHTDYNGGFTLPLALPYATTVELLPTRDDQIVVTSLRGADHADTCRYRLGEERSWQDWRAYIQGVTQLLREQGHAIAGFQALIRSTVPTGRGLAASAALEVGLLRALRQGFSLDLDDVTIARLGQEVDSHVVGARVGIMDPLGSSVGREDAALFLDSQDFSWRYVVLPATVDVVVIHSGVIHPDPAPYYAARRQECEQAAIALDVPQLRVLDPDDLPRLAKLPDLLARRARHVITENARVLAAVDALDKGDVTTVGRLFHESHRSMRDDYGITVPEVDLLVDLLRFEPSVYGARMTGHGFGGAVVALIEAGRGTVIAKKIARRYAEQSGRQPAIVLPT